MIEEFWQKSKAKKMWDNLQSSSKNHTSRDAIICDDFLMTLVSVVTE